MPLTATPPPAVVIIRTVKPTEQRYATVGDYETKRVRLELEPGSGTPASGANTTALVVTVTDTGNPDDALLTAMHELTEAYLVRKAAITEAQIDAFDLAHPELDEPGDDRAAPYHEAHRRATFVERAVAHALDRDWRSYEAALDAALKETKRHAAARPPSAPERDAPEAAAPLGGPS